MKITKILFMGLALMAFSFQSNAQTTKKTVVQKQVNQNARINQGVRSGELTKAETRQLKKQQRDINRTKKAAKADGVVTRRERAVIHHKQNKASANIAHKKNNPRTR